MADEKSIYDVDENGNSAVRITAAILPQVNKSVYIQDGNGNAALRIMCEDGSVGKNVDWGNILGDIENQTDLKNILDVKADLVDGKVPSTQLPQYVSDIIEVDTYTSLPEPGLSDKIYVTLDTNLTYRWGGTTYVEISKSLALGETQLTAHRGDHGKIAYDHSQTTGNPHGTTKGDIGLSEVDNTADADKPISEAQQLALNLKADDTSVVHKEGTETVSGDKNFTGKFALSTNIDDVVYANFGKGFNANNNTYYENDKLRINSYFSSPWLNMGLSSNLLLQSEVFNASNWVKTNLSGTVVADSCLAPTAVLNAENIPAGTIDTANIAQTVTETTIGMVCAGVWARAQSGTCIIKLRIDSSAETGIEKSFDLTENWRFIETSQEFTQVHTNKVFRIINGTNAISLWAAQMNMGPALHVYRATTTSAFGIQPAIFFNYTVYGGTFSGAFSGNATTSTYSTSGLYSGGTITNLTDKTGLWEYCGYISMGFATTYSYGQSFTKRLMFAEMATSNSDTSVENLETFFVDIKVNMESVGGNATTFNTTVPIITVEVFGKTNLTKDDIVAFVYSSSIATKTIRLYVKLKSPNKHYMINSISYMGFSYTTTKTATANANYTSWVQASTQPTVATLPPVAQGPYVYGIIKSTEDAVGNVYTPAHIVPGKLAEAPSIPIEGGLYYNTTDKHLYVYNGTEYKQLDN